MNAGTVTAVSGPVAATAPDAETLPWWARRTGFGWISAVTGLFSLIAAAVLVGERVELYIDANHHSSCDLGGAFSCTSVMESKAAAAFGFPNPFIGLVGFTVLVVVGMSLVAGAQMKRWYWIGYQIGVVLAFAFLVWLYTQALYVIGALCLYCMVCWLMMTYLTCLSLARSVLTGVIAAPRWLLGWARGWAWTSATLISLACAATILIRFMYLFTN